MSRKPQKATLAYALMLRNRKVPPPESFPMPQTTDEDMPAMERLEFLGEEPNLCCMAIHWLTDKQDRGYVCELRAGHGGKWHEQPGVGRWPVGGGALEPAVDIIKTWPNSTPARIAYDIFRDPYPATFYFTLGKGRPNAALRALWFTYNGRIVARFPILSVVINDGSLPRLRAIDGEGEWHIKPDRWVAICGPCEPFRERLYMAGFRGWRYFNVDEYRETAESKARW